MALALASANVLAAAPVMELAVSASAEADTTAVPAASIKPRQPPPAPLLGPLSPIGQTNAVGAAAAGPASVRVFAYYGVPGVWADFGTADVGFVPLAAIPVVDGVRIEGEDGAAVVIRLQTARRLLTWIDWAVIGVYLAGMAGIGWYFYKRESRASTAGYFLGGRSIPWWAAGLSLYATGTSAISFIAIPAKAYAENWLYLCQNIVGLAGTAYAAYKIIPLIRRLNLTSVYHYLELRFHPSVRVCGSFLQILFQLVGRMSIVLFLPALAISGVTGTDVVLSVVLMGIVTTLYTFLGGMKAVIWTDVIQVFVMVGGALVAIAVAVAAIPGGLVGLGEIALRDDKLRTFDFSWDFAIPTVWAVMLLEIFNILTWPRDQVMMQRVLSTRDERAARNSVLTLAAVVLPGSLMFYSIGTVLYGFYQAHPERMNPLLPTDATFPQFIATELPPGLTGLIIAGLFAASMSTLSSGLNSVATMVAVDFYERFRRPRPDAGPDRTLRVATVITFLAGAISTLAAVLLAFFDIKSLFDASLSFAAVLGGGFAGCYALGIFTRRANWQGALIGSAASIAFAFGAKEHLSPLLQSGFAVGVCILVGYLASYAFPGPAQDLRGLTIHRPPPGAS